MDVQLECQKRRGVSSAFCAPAGAGWNGGQAEDVRIRAWLSETEQRCREAQRKKKLHPDSGSSGWSGDRQETTAVRRSSGKLQNR